MYDGVLRIGDSNKNEFRHVSITFLNENTSTFSMDAILKVPQEDYSIEL